MKNAKARKILWAITLFAVILLSINILLLKAHFSPSSGGNFQLAGLTGKVKVIRDSWGVPHIYADNTEDAYRTLGFVKAQDRLFQMDLQRRIANGELSEIFGEQLIDVDRLYRTLKLKSHAKQFLEKHKSEMNAQMLREAEAYLAGLNHFIHTQPLPLEFVLLGYKPREFELSDVLSFIGFMSYGFADGARADIFFERIKNSNKLSQDEWNDLKLDYATSGPMIMDQGRSSSGARTLHSKKTYAHNSQTKIDLDYFSQLDNLLSPFGLFQGSNSWVLAASRSTSNKPLLANDPHIGFTNPSVWWEAHIVTPQWQMYGHYLAHIPFAVLGNNQKYGWALTMAEYDDLDFYREPDSAELATLTEAIKVKNAPDVSLKIETSSHGPIMNSAMKIADARPIALKWTYYEDSNFVLDAIYGMNTANNMNEFNSALAKAAGPGLNVSYADEEGNISWWVLGKIPKRNLEIGATDFVLDGADKKQDWQGYLTFEENPHLVNPPSGIIVTANNRFSTTTSHKTINGYYQNSDRAYQIEKLLAQKEKWSLAELKNVQFNNDEPYAKDFLPTLIENYDNALIKTNNLVFEKQKEEAFAQVKSWKGSCAATESGCSIYHQWNIEILKLMLESKLSKEEIKIYYPLAQRWNFQKSQYKNLQSKWWQGDAKKLISQAFKNSVSTLSEKMGADVKYWHWGNTHTVEYEHPIGKKKPLNKIFNVGPMPASGSRNNVNAMGEKDFDKLFSVQWGPSTRRLIDFSKPELPLGITPLGQSGNIFSSHYSDQAKPFVKGEYRDVWIHKNDVEAHQETESNFSN